MRKRPMLRMNKTNFIVKVNCVKRRIQKIHFILEEKSMLILI